MGGYEWHLQSGCNIFIVCNVCNIFNRLVSRGWEYAYGNYMLNDVMHSKTSFIHEALGGFFFFPFLGVNNDKSFNFSFFLTSHFCSCL